MLKRLELDFWNNPLVVSALRLRIRRGSPVMFMTGYLLLLGVVCAFIYQYRVNYLDVWPQICLAVVLGVQTVVSGIVAMTSLSASMQAEVLNRTLDFQRIAAISPLKILIGKLFGEAALAFLLIAAALPLVGVLCAAGAAAPWDVAVVYIQVVTTTLAAGAVGMIHPLELPEGKTSGGSSPRGPAVGVSMTMIFVLPSLIGNFASAVQTPAVSALLATFTPAVGIYGLFQDNLWTLRWPFFGFGVPFAIVGPLLQLVLVWIVLIGMRRRMINPQDPALDKTTALFVVALVDLLAASLFFDSSPLAADVVVRAAGFVVVHLVVTYIAAAASCPNRRSTESFQWRRRGPYPPHLWWGDRAVNTAWVIAATLVGQAVFWGLIVAADARFHADTPWTTLSQLAAAATLLSIALTTLLQFVAMHANKGAFWLVLIAFALASSLPHVAGEYYRNVELLALAPSAHFAGWFGGDLQLQSWRYTAMLLAPCGLVAAATLAGQFRRNRYLKAKVDARIRSMQTPPPASTPALS